MRDVLRDGFISLRTKAEVFVSKVGRIGDDLGQSSLRKIVEDTALAQGLADSCISVFGTLGSDKTVHSLCGRLRCQDGNGMCTQRACGTSDGLGGVSLSWV